MRNDEAYSLEEVADEHEAIHYVGIEDHEARELAGSLYTASEMIGHSNKSLRDSVAIAQQLVGDTSDINLRPFEVSDESISEGTAYLQMISDKAKVCLGQAKMRKSDDVDTYKKVAKLINGIGTAEDYKEFVC